MNASTVAPSNPPLVAQLAEDVTSLRTQLGGAIEVIGNVYNRLADTDGDKSIGERLGEAAPLARQAIILVGRLEPRLQKFTTNLSNAQSTLQGLNDRTLSWISVIAVGLSLLTLLMAAGQLALCRLAWTTTAKTSAG